MKIKTLIVIAHPDTSSLNHAILKKVREKLAECDTEVTVKDLYQMGFDPVLPLADLKQKISSDKNIQALTREMQEADVYIFIHPDWWGQMPAILKGYIDRVWQPYLAYAHKDKRSSQGMLKGKRGLAIVTTDGDAQESMTIESVWQERVFNFCGIGRGEVNTLYQANLSSPAEREDFIIAVCQRAQYMIKDLAELI
jgi:putative NADPH-quinone reductase